MSVFGSGDYDRKKKSSSRLSGKLVLAITTGKKKVPVVCLAGLFWGLRPEKKSSSCLSGWLCCCCSGDYDRKKKSPVVCLAGCQFLVLEITTGKKKFQSSVWRIVLLRQFLVLAITTGKKKVPVVCLGGLCYDRKKKKFQSSPERLRPENKKVQVVIKFVLVQLELKLIQIVSSTSTYPLHIRSIHTISCKIRHVIQIIPH